MVFFTVSKFKIKFINHYFFILMDIVQYITYAHGLKIQGRGYLKFLKNYKGGSLWEYCICHKVPLSSLCLPPRPTLHTYVCTHAKAQNRLHIFLVGVVAKSSWLSV